MTTIEHTLADGSTTMLLPGDSLRTFLLKHPDPQKRAFRSLWARLSMFLDEQLIYPAIGVFTSVMSGTKRRS
jgi:hypothetical protein